MDEATFLRILRDEPDNEEVRSGYLRSLEELGDQRAAFVQLMSKRLKLQNEMDEIDAALHAHGLDLSVDWVEAAFPLRIRSPMVGRCYTKPTLDAPPFVSKGQSITPDKVVCLIEAMELYTEINAGVHGVVTEIAVANGDPVEYDQVLFRVARPPNPLDLW